MPAPQAPTNPAQVASLMQGLKGLRGVAPSPRGVTSPPPGRQITVHPLAPPAAPPGVPAAMIGPRAGTPSGGVTPAQIWASMQRGY